MDKSNETRVWWTMYWPKHLIKTMKRFRFNVGDRVRISHLSNIFTREYDDKWTGEIFIMRLMPISKCGRVAKRHFVNTQNNKELLAKDVEPGAPEE